VRKSIIFDVVKKIGILSDTHGYFDPKLKDVFADVDEIWHAGDIGDNKVLEELRQIHPVIAVYGNIDNPHADEDCKLNQIFSCESKKVLITHIGGYPGKYSSRVKKILKEQPDIGIVVCGHSHITKVMPDHKFHHLHINPGAAGREGFHTFRTVIRIQIDGNKIHHVELIELGKRGAIYV
jgi:putative phosphoesterase